MGVSYAFMYAAIYSEGEQMLTNLALNARDAMPDGGVLHMALKRRRVVSREAAPLPGMQPGPWRDGLGCGG